MSLKTNLVLKFYLFLVFLRYNWPITLYKFKVYGMLISYASILQSDYHCGVS